MDEEFDSLAGLFHAYNDHGEINAMQTDQERLIQAIAFSKSLTEKKNRALKRHTPRKLPVTGWIPMHPLEPVKNTTPWRLRSKALPRLYQCFSQLCTCLDPFTIRSEDISHHHRFREALDILAQLNYRIDDVNLTIASLWDPPNPTDDQHLERTTEWTVQRCHRLISEYESLLFWLSYLLGDFEKVISHLLPHEDHQGTSRRLPTEKVYLLSMQDPLHSITSFITWLNQSNLTELHNSWRRTTFGLGYVLSLDLAKIQGIVPLVKLSRVLVHKLYHLTPHSQYIERTHLSLLEALQDAIQPIPHHLYHISQTLRCTRRPQETKLTRHMNALARSFKRIKVVLIPLVDSFVPLSSPYKPETPHATTRQWCQLWISHCDLAINHFLRVLLDFLMNDIPIDPEDPEDDV
ncbi:hypothetical protein PCANC_09779 [Puccinia coronata f. sp. avenae]|uniref:Uncharacterized protein n=1 Tax=Puccinia coronata f. sp. avenae TaxID=200324 RepID=A0A2N5VT75_9BASI|nr:hypothetical protein PCANC_09779 [Puccinia coronata f. sp. avenae]